MRLAICDDNELERRILHSLLKKYFSEASISCEFTLYDHGTTLYYDIMDGMEFDIIFLDLFMEDLDMGGRYGIFSVCGSSSTVAESYSAPPAPIMHWKATASMPPDIS